MRYVLHLHDGTHDDSTILMTLARNYRINDWIVSLKHDHIYAKTGISHSVAAVEKVYVISVEASISGKLAGIRFDAVYRSDQIKKVLKAEEIVRSMCVNNSGDGDMNKTQTNTFEFKDCVVSTFMGGEFRLKNSLTLGDLRDGIKGWLSELNDWGDDEAKLSECVIINDRLVVTLADGVVL